MADKKDSALDKAESFARRVLERLGARVDSKLGSSNQETLSPREVGELTSRLERAIEARLTEDEKGVKRVSPNRFKVLFTYEESSRLNTQYIEALAGELKATVYEFINNRRYETRGPIEVETGRDLFAKSTVIKANFDAEEEAEKPDAAAAPQLAGKQPSTERKIYLATASGQQFSVELKAEAAPAYIGRASGVAVRIDDPSVSRMHCSLALKSSGEIVVADLGSANGTYVNGSLLSASEARPVQSGDVLGVGDFSLTISEDH